MTHHQCLNFDTGCFHTQHPYSGVGCLVVVVVRFFFFSVSHLAAWTRWGQSAYLAFSFWLNFSPSCLLIRVIGSKNMHIHFLNISARV